MYTQIYSNKEEAYKYEFSETQCEKDYPLIVKARDAGCGCCSSVETLLKEDIVDHIEYLKIKLEQSEEYLRIMEDEE